MSIFKLLTQKRFGPIFSVQFMGSLNDNLFKNTMVILFAFRAATEAKAGMITNLAAGLFILPYLLFSGTAGLISDKYDKAKIMRIIKTAELGIMALGSIGFFTGNIFVLFITLFLMGTHSAFFGPAKYSILPQYLKPEELMTGNALIEMGTFLAILLGTIGGGLLAGYQNTALISGVIISVAIIGYLASLKLPPAPAIAPELKVSLNPFSQMVVLTKLIRKKPALFNSIMGISWFWYFGATVLTQLPNLTKHIIHGDESVVTLLLAAFSVSIGLGSIICAKLSRGDIELALVPIGALGMTIFCSDLAFISYPPEGTALMNVSALLQGPHLLMAMRVVFDLGMVGFFTSFFIVPLYALIQMRSDEDSRSRVIAANNIFNALFMVVSAILTIVLLKAGLNTPEILLFTAILNLVVSAYIFLLIPEFFMRFVIWILASTIYRLKYAGKELVPQKGSALIVCNHVSFIDWFVITATCRRPVHFIMDHNVFKNPLMGWIFKLSKAIPIAPAKEDAAMKTKAFEIISERLRDDNLVCIFPEGKITYDGNINPFRLGVEKILARDPVPVVPMAINGLWGSFFSRAQGKAMTGVPKPSRRIIAVTVGECMNASTKATEMEIRVKQLLVKQD